MTRKKFIEETINLCKVLGNGPTQLYYDYEHSNLNLNEVKNFIEDHCFDLNPKDERRILDYLDSIPQIPEFKQAHQRGGVGEGDGYYLVWQIDHPEYGEIFICHSGWYASFHGSELEDAYEVEPKQVQVTKYIPVGS